MGTLGHPILLSSRAGDIAGRADKVSERDVTALMSGAALCEVCCDLARERDA